MLLQNLKHFCNTIQNLLLGTQGMSSCRLNQKPPNDTDFMKLPLEVTQI